MDQSPLVSSLQFLLNFSVKLLKKPDHSSLPGFLEFHLRASHSSLFDWLSIRLAFWCCHALRLDTSATRSSASVGGSLLHARTRLPRSRFGTTCSAVRLMASVEADSISLILLPLGGFVLRKFPIVSATSFGRSESVVKRYRSMVI